MAIFHPQIRKRQLRDSLVYWLYLPALVLGTGRIIDLLAGLSAHPLWLAGGVALVAGGTIIRQATVDLAVYGDGTPSPFRPARKLVTRGSYRYCRHPMWLGYDLMALGVILLLGSPGALCFSFPVFVAGQVEYLRREEKILRARFKEAYRRYQQTTGMLLPTHLLIGTGKNKP